MSVSLTEGQLAVVRLVSAYLGGVSLKREDRDFRVKLGDDRLGINIVYAASTGNAIHVEIFGTDDLTALEHVNLVVRDQETRKIEACVSFIKSPSGFYKADPFCMDLGNAKFEVVLMDEVGQQIDSSMFQKLQDLLAQAMKKHSFMSDVLVGDTSDVCCRIQHFATKLEFMIGGSNPELAILRRVKIRLTIESENYVEELSFFNQSSHVRFEASTSLMRSKTFKAELILVPDLEAQIRRLLNAIADNCELAAVTRNGGIQSGPFGDSDLGITVVLSYGSAQNADVRITSANPVQLKNTRIVFFDKNGTRAGSERLQPSDRHGACEWFAKVTMLPNEALTFAFEEIPYPLVIV